MCQSRKLGQLVHSSSKKGYKKELRQRETQVYSIVTHSAVTWKRIFLWHSFQNRTNSRPISSAVLTLSLCRRWRHTKATYEEDCRCTDISGELNSPSFPAYGTAHQWQEKALQRYLPGRLDNSVCLNWPNEQYEMGQRMWCHLITCVLWWIL